MLIDKSALKSNLTGLVGFYNATNPDYPNLLPSLVSSRSGKIVNEVHPLLSIENIDQSVKNFSHANYPTYSSGTDTNGGYTLGSKVTYENKNYEYINSTASSGNAPPNGTYWEEINELSDVLIKATHAAIDKVIDDWSSDKKLRQKVKSIYDKVLLFNGSANYRDKIVNNNELVGLRFRFKRGENSLVSIINKIGAHFDGTGDVTLYLYHSSQADPISTIALTHSKANSQQWTTLSQGNLMRYVSDDYEAGGDFYLCYKQSEIQSAGLQAFKMDLDWHSLPCDCDQVWRGYYQQYSPFIDVVGFSIAESELGAGDTLFDTDKVSINYRNNYGLNCDLSLKCDIGAFVLTEEELFAEAVQYGTALKLLKEIAYSTRSGVAQQIKAEAKKELFHSQGVYGTVYDHYQAAIKGLSFDLSGLAEECFPCDDHEEGILGFATLR